MKACKCGSYAINIERYKEDAKCDVCHYKLKVTLNSFITDPIPDGQRFVALYDDGSGASLYVKRKTQYGDLVDAEGSPAEEKLMIENGYLHWIPLPDDYLFWHELAFK